MPKIIAQSALGLKAAGLSCRSTRSRSCGRTAIEAKGPGDLDVSASSLRERGGVKEPLPQHASLPARVLNTFRHY